MAKKEVQKVVVQELETKLNAHKAAEKVKDPVCCDDPRVCALETNLCCKVM